jgi:hypothetical protein
LTGAQKLDHGSPTLAPNVLRDTLKVPLPDFTEARIESGDLTEVVPRELRADEVIGLYSGAARVMSIVVEAQLKLPNMKKLRAWVGYVAGSFARDRYQVCLLVVTTKPAVTARCAEPIVIGPRSSISPFVLGPGSVGIDRACSSAVIGRAEGKAEDVLEVLEARGLAIPDDVRQRVMASTNLAELRRWLRRAVVVSSAGEIFGKAPYASRPSAPTCIRTCLPFARTLAGEPQARGFQAQSPPRLLRLGLVPEQLHERRAFGDRGLHLVEGYRSELCLELSAAATYLGLERLTLLIELCQHHTVVADGRRARPLQGESAILTALGPELVEQPAIRRSKAPAQGCKAIGHSIKHAPLPAQNRGEREPLRILSVWRRLDMQRDVTIGFIPE